MWYTSKNKPRRYFGLKKVQRLITSGSVFGQLGMSSFLNLSSNWSLDCILDVSKSYLGGGHLEALEVEELCM